jgi:adenylate kinase
MNLLFLGPPGSGKGTQAVRAARQLGITHLSTGDVLREAVKKGTELGRKAKRYMEKGELVPDSVLIDMIEDKIDGGHLGDGFILDGFPRTMPQAESLKQMLASHDMSLDRAVLLVVDDEEIVKRLSGRWFCPQCRAGYNYPAQVPKVKGRCDHDNAELQRRPDDEEDVVRNRLQVYKKQTKPIVDFYRNESILAEVVGIGSPDKVFESVLQAVKETVR